jgi:hypothetical protein
MRGLLASLLFIPLVACSMNAPSDAAGTGSSGSATPVAPGPITVRLTQRAATEGDATLTATGGTGTVAVRGSLSAPNPCHVLTGTAAREGRTVTLTVASRASGNPCIQSIGTLGYDATLAGLEAGTYSLRVVHTYPGTGWETKTALTKDVQVR